MNGFTEQDAVAFSVELATAVDEIYFLKASE